MDSSQKMVVSPMNLDDVDLKIGFIGAGKMAQALCAGFINASKYIMFHHLLCNHALLLYRNRMCFYAEIHWVNLKDLHSISACMGMKLF